MSVVPTEKETKTETKPDPKNVKWKRSRRSSATFSTASVKTGKAQIEHMFSGLPPKAPAAMESAALTPPVRPRAQGADAFLRGELFLHAIAEDDPEVGARVAV